MVYNPYAKKKSSAPQETSTDAAAVPIPPAAAPPLFSFTQAFEDVVALPPPPATDTNNPGSGILQTTAAPSHSEAAQLNNPQVQNNNTSNNSNAADQHVWIGAQPHVLYVSPRQKGNPVLSHIRNVPWHYQTMAPDYMFNSTSCALFLSIKYHLLHPQYIVERMAELHFKFQVLVVYVDATDNTKVIASLNTLCVRHAFTLILAFSEQEAARYLETYKAMEGKDAATMLVQRKGGGTYGFGDYVMDALTAIPKVNKQDATHLVTQFDSIKAVAKATPDELALVAGLGQVKVQRIYDAFHKPFSKLAAAERRKERLAGYQRQAAEAKQAEEEMEQNEKDDSKDFAEDEDP